MFAAARSLPSLALVRAAPRAVARTVNASSGPIEIELIVDRREFDALEADWNDLFDRAGKPTHVFQTFNFCWHWANHFLGSSNGGKSRIELCVVTGRRDGRLIMVWPLVAESMRGITQIFWMGEPASQYGDALIEPACDVLEILRAGYDALRTQSQADLLRLRRVRADANVAPLMAEIAARAADRQVAPNMNLASAKDFSTFEQRYSGKTRKNRRRLARRFEEMGNAEFERLHGGEAARDLAVQAIALKDRWLQNRGLISNAITNSRMSRLFADLAEGRTKPAGCIVSALKSKGIVAAAEVSFVCKGRLAMHLIAFNLDYEKSGAGVLLLEQSLKDGYTEKLGVYDMLAPGDAYKFDWCDSSDPVIDWVKPFTLKGDIYAKIWLAFLRGHVKAKLKSMPQPLRRLLRGGAKRSASHDTETSAT